MKLDKLSKELELLFSTLQAVKINHPKHFSGIGIIVYNGEFLENNKFISLRPNVKPPKDLMLGTKKCIDYLSAISCYRHALHDGYIFVKKTGLFTHVAQFLEVHLDPETKPHKDHGTRYLCSLIASKEDGVEGVGNLSSDWEICIFRKGKVLD